LSRRKIVGKKLSDDELQAWRAARTGKAVNFGGGSEGRHPEEDPSGAGPIGDLDDLSGDDPSFDPTALDTASGGDPTRAPPPRQPDDAQQRLDAALGRVAPLQRQLQEANEANRSLADTVTALTQRLDAMTADGARARAEQEAEAFDPFEGMTQDQLDNLDPAVVDAMRRAARKSLATTLSKVQDPAALIEKAMAERDNRRLKSYLKQISDELNLQAVADDPQFNAYAQEHGSADMLVSSLLQSATVDIAQALKPRVTKMLAGFQTWKTAKKSADAQPGDPTPRTPGSYASRGPAGSGSGSQRRVVNGPADMARLRAEHAAATRRRDFKEAKRLLDIINA
jgi:hypothetical protein